MTKRENPKQQITNKRLKNSFSPCLEFACPPAFWWGACNLELVCFWPDPQDQVFQTKQITGGNTDEKALSDNNNNVLLLFMGWKRDCDQRQ
jgi:hypothetical protein